MRWSVGREGGEPGGNAPCHWSLCPSINTRTTSGTAPVCAGGLHDAGSISSCALRDPSDELLSRRIRWFAALANDHVIVDSIHRAMAAPNCTPLVEPTGWTVYCNSSSIIQPQHTVWMYGSICSSWSAAAVMPSIRYALTCRIHAPQSSTQFDLVAPILMGFAILSMDHGFHPALTG